MTSVLDLCTGSGCWPFWRPARSRTRQWRPSTFPPTRWMARENVALHGLDHVVTLHEGDLFAPLGDARFDLIISNPPYVTDDSMATLPDEFHHEPALALAAGDDGNDILRRMLRGAKKHLTADGVMLVDMGHNRDLLRPNFLARLLHVARNRSKRCRGLHVAGPGSAVKKAVILIGGGHAHVEVLRQLAVKPSNEFDIALFDPSPSVWYSGMLPGVIAGHYEPAHAKINLWALCQRARVRFFETPSSASTGTTSASRVASASATGSISCRSISAAWRDHCPPRLART